MARQKVRTNGEGTVVELRDGRWAAIVTVGWKGDRQQRVKREAKTKAEARQKLRELLRQLEEGVDLTQREPLLREYLDEWFATSFAPHARPKSQETYRLAIDRYIVPQLGDLRVSLKALNARRLRMWLADLQKPKDDGGLGLSAKSATLARTVLRKALAQAVVDKLLTRNPIDRDSVRPPRLPKSPAKALTRQQADALLKAARAERLEAALRLLFLGLRRGEVAALKWSDVDLEAATITVRGTLGYVKGFGLVEGETKSEQGVRTLPLPASVVASLRWHQNRQRAERNAMGWSESPYVFTSPKTGGRLYSNLIYQAFKRCCEATGLEGFSPHSARHSAASFLIAMKAHPKHISAWLGHSSIKITMDLYGHLFPDAFDGLAEGLDDFLAGDQEGRTREAGNG